MCELFALNASCDVDITDYLKVFYSHCDKHPNGWGLSYLKNDNTVFHKEAVKASESTLLNDILSNRIITNNLLAHIRLATIGDMTVCNCHPFELTDNNNRRWILIHNGTIFNYPALDNYEDIQMGNTDSERILHHIVDCVNENENDEKLDDDALCELINDIICRLSRDNKLNLILSNGQLTFLHSNCEKSLYYLQKDDCIIVSTLALSSEYWIEVDLNTVYAIRDAQIIYKGPAHENKYVISEDDIEFILDSLSDDAMCKLLDSYGSVENIKRQLSNKDK